MTVSLIGIESEYAFVPIGSRGRRSDVTTSLAHLFKIARSELVSLPDANAYGLFLANGSRLYLDAGDHPELSTPECSNPSDVVRYTIAGEKILAGLLAKLRENYACRNALLFKCNVDYSGAGTTWGCHESYPHKVPQKKLADEIIPHLVSRVVFSGAGGFSPMSAGLEFTLSPRVDHLKYEISDSSTGSRGIFHTKDEPLCSGGYHRLHILCGESLCSHLAQFLKIGTTALVVALIENGAVYANAVSLHGSLDAMKRIARDEHCAITVEGRRDRKITALAIQHQYLEAAERSLDADFMPDWAVDVCREWRSMLDRLADAPDTVSTTLDWAVKREIFRAHTARRGIDWDQLTQWTDAANVFWSIARENRRSRQRLTSDLVREDTDRVREARTHLKAYLSARGLTWDGFEAFLHLREELFEIDTRFGQLGEDGIFAKLDRCDLLDHRLEGVTNFDDAIENPPSSGRAHERGRQISELAGARERYCASWDCIRDRKGGRYLDLSDPYGKSVEWQSGVERS